MKKIIFLLIAIATSIGIIYAQSGKEYRRTGILNRNQVRTVFGNWGVIGQPAELGKRGAWRHDNNGYLGDVSPLVGAEVKYKHKTRGQISFRWVEASPVDRPQQTPLDESPEGKQWTLEPVSGYFNANKNSVAISRDRSTFPPYWPDKMSDDVDPGWSGQWNGYFGKKKSADLETYFVMDDNNSERFSYVNFNADSIEFRPDSLNLNRKGLGLVVRVRGMQWQFPAQDNIFWLYEITNTGTTNYDRAVFGMLVGTYVGCTSSDHNPHEYDNDWSFYDAVNNITYTGNYDGDRIRNPLWVGPVGMVGYAFLESPGNPFDGIDNDGDADSVLISFGVPSFDRDFKFDSTLLVAGMNIVLINDDFTRKVYTIPNDTSVTIYTRGKSITIKPGITKVAEGNLVTDAVGNSVVNRNSFDGIDNNFNGIIDENYYLHYHQFKRGTQPPYIVMIDKVRPLKYVDYLTNNGTSPYSMIDEKRNDLVDNDKDWNSSFDDVGRDGVAGTKDFGEGDGQPTSGYNGLFKDTGLPGEPNIDKTDVNESDQIGLTSFWYFTPANRISFGDKEALWSSLSPGYFDVPASIEFDPIIKDSRPTSGEDGDFIYGSGYFPLLAGETERFSLALVYGGGKAGMTITEEIADLLYNKKSVQKIYDGNYQFQQPPDPPKLTAVPGDRQVTLYWDRKAEESIDPVQRIKDFEGYRIYRSSDPNFSDVHTVTDADGNIMGYDPLAQYDLKDSVVGYFYPSSGSFQGLKGYTFFLGEDRGIVHSFVDKGLENGKKYYYAVCAYDKGNELLDIFPMENSKEISIDPTGQVSMDENVAIVVPNKPSAGYLPAPTGILLNKVSVVGTGSIRYQVLDDSRLTGHTYRVTFMDTMMDSIDNDKNGKMDLADTLEWGKYTTSYSVLDLNPINESISVTDTGIIHLAHSKIIGSTFELRNSSGSIMPSSAYWIDTSIGIMKIKNLTLIPKGKYQLKYQFYPIFKNPYIKNSPYEKETQDAEPFDGLILDFENHWNIYIIDSLSGWIGTEAYKYQFTKVNLPSLKFVGYARPSDYEIQFDTVVVDTSLSLFGAKAYPLYFRFVNKSENRTVKILYQPRKTAPPFVGHMTPRDFIYLMEPMPNGDLVPTWQFYPIAKQDDPTDTTYFLTSSDKVIITMYKPFRNGDIFEFTPTLGKIDNSIAKNSLEMIRVVPNPYITSHSHEPPLPPGITSGRGQRRIDFINCPVDAKISIFTSRGDHVITLNSEGDMRNGVVSWNLKTKENLDIAFGVYFYVVESSVGNKTGKIAIIK